MGRLGGEIILLNCCKKLQISRTLFQVVAVLAEGKSCCLYRTFVTWKLGCWAPFKLAEGLPTRWRPLYDHYGPVRPGLLRRCAVPSPEPPITSAIVRLRFQRGNPAAKLAASAAMQQKRYDTSWGESTMSKKSVTTNAWTGHFIYATFSSARRQHLPCSTR